LKKENIKEQLETYSILKNINMNKKELVKELKLVLAKETLKKILDISILSLSNYIQNLPKNEKSDTDSNIRHDNINKSERHTAKIPKLETIQNWISYYSRQHLQEVAEIIAQ
ncbi:33334_t:CDS:2, partial [Gigaspora margarita]